jgi:hypothetical protein
MMWNELFIKKDICRNDLVKTLSNTFNVKDNNILIVGNIEVLEPLNCNIKLLCETSKVDAEFFIKVSIYVRDDDLEPTSDLEKIKEISKGLNIEILTSDDLYNPHNPSSMLVVNPNGEFRQTFIDIDKYDKSEEYELK